MLKKIALRKIAIASSILIIMTMLYLIPVNKNNSNIDINQQVEYIYPNDLEVIYLLNTDDYLSMTKISTSNKDIITKANDLIEGLIVNGKKQDIIPRGFKPLLPKGTKVIELSLNNGILMINFSKEFNNVDIIYEEKLVEALAYTLTSIEGIDKLDIYVEGNKLEYLPHSKEKLPKYIDKHYGINKQYELTKINDVLSYTIYYVFNYNDDVYYTPVTKYINNENQDKVKIIIDELASSFIYESNLMSYLDTNIKLIDYQLDEDIIKLNFNELLLSDITNNLILEEVMYTIGLSVCNELEIKEVVFEVNNREISTFSLKNVDLNEKMLYN